MPSYCRYSLRRVIPSSLLPSVLLAALFASLPAVQGAAASDLFPTIPESNWAGLRLIILPQSRAVQHYGYQELYRDTDKEFVPLPYAEFAGRIVRVVKIEQGHGPNGETLDEANLQLEDDKKTIHGDMDGGCMNDVAPVSDLETARKLYLGKTLWLASDHLSSYDAQKDVSDSPASSTLQETFRQIKVKQYSPVKVVDIVPGWYASAPDRFIVQEEATKVSGYVDVHMSNTNVPKDLQAVSRFETIFLESDPRKTLLWPAKVWTAIENKEVFVGMTASQVRMSWGAPKTVSVLELKQTEQWAYMPNFSLTLKNGILTNIGRL